jgi:hypothetical protein
MAKRLILILAALAGMAAFSSEAGAVVCARGVYRAGCAGPRGAVVGHRGYARPYYNPYRGGVVVHRRYW